eukprot:4099877-Prymnesium_polylepis.1
MVSLDEAVVWRAERRRVGRATRSVLRSRTAARSHVSMGGRRDGRRAQPSFRRHLWPGWPQD